MKKNPFKSDNQIRRLKPGKIFQMETAGKNIQNLLCRYEAEVFQKHNGAAEASIKKYEVEVAAFQRRSGEEREIGGFQINYFSKSDFILRSCSRPGCDKRETVLLIPADQLHHVPGQGRDPLAEKMRENNSYVAVHKHLTYLEETWMNRWMLGPQMQSEKLARGIGKRLLYKTNSRVSFPPLQNKWTSPGFAGTPPAAFSQKNPYPGLQW